MESDLCIAVSEDDHVVNAFSKKDCHRVDAAQPRGVLHRAFSVFAFDQQGRLLLQQRAADKITFPGVWTNTCCSHQLSQMQPREEDSQREILDGSVPGTKAAARRKLWHELGLQSERELDFQFITRLHYWAIDTQTHGLDSPWCEHEVDYILVTRLPEEGVTMQVNPEEVQAVTFASPKDLEDMLADDRNTWSPWFRIVATDENFLPRWWGALDALAPAAGSAKVPLDFELEREHRKIYRMDPDPVFMGKSGRGLAESIRRSAGHGAGPRPQSE